MSDKFKTFLYYFMLANVLFQCSIVVLVSKERNEIKEKYEKTQIELKESKKDFKRASDTLKETNGVLAATRYANEQLNEMNSKLKGENYFLESQNKMLLNKYEIEENLNK